MPRRFDETVNIQQVDTRTGITQAESSLADRLSQFSSGLAQKSVQLGQQASQQAGLESGQAEALRDESGQLITPEFKKKPLFIGGVEVDAHNKALRARYLAELNNDNRESIAGIVANNPDKLLNFNDSIKGYRDGVLKGVEPSVRAAVSEDLDNMVTSARIRVQGADIQRQRKENIEGLASAAEGTFDSAYSLMRGGDGLSAGEAMHEGIKAVDAMVEAGYITEAQGQDRKRQANKELAEQSFKGAMDAVYDQEGINGVNSWLSENEGKTKAGFTADEWDSVTDQIQADANRKESRRNAARGKINKEAQNSLRQYKLAKSLGFEVSPQDEAALNMAIAGTDLVVPKKIIDDTAKFSVMSRDQRSSVLGAAQTGQLADVDLFASITKADQEINRLATEDGYSLGVKQGIIEAEPLDLSDPDLFQGRVALSEMLTSHYGVDVSPLSDGEATSLSASIPAMTPLEKVQLANTLSVSPAVWGQLDKKNAGQFAMAGATGDETVMTAVFNGQELLKEGLVTRVKQTDYLSTFNDAVEGVYEAQDRKAILDAVISHYSATSTGAIDGNFDAGDFESSIAAVTGGISKINGFNLELPRGTDEDDFDNFIDSMQPEFIEKAGGVANFTDKEAVEKIQRGRIRSIGTNQYIVESDGGTLFNNKGQPFIFSYSLDDAATNEALRKSRTLSRSKRGFKRERPE